ncbi:hypothetical membrane protein [Cutibacterium acnes JCM 18920]|nr:hypothetical membrane protein [Cutibacterium acnes JCM 18920]
MWFWVLVTCYWALVWRTPVWDIDDLYFATRSGTPGGRIDWADFARLTVCDLVERNGRFSDMMVQLVMAMGGMDSRSPHTLVCDGVAGTMAHGARPYSRSTGSSVARC